MRVVAGIYGGRRLASFKGRSIRPTSDKVRQAVFNVIASGSEGLGVRRVLDLFAGTGAMGIEAVSRGAESAVFVESDAGAAKVIEKNISALGIETASIIKKDAIEAIKILSREKAVFDLVIIDPPYDAGLVLNALLELDASCIVEPGGIVVAEGPSRVGMETSALKNLVLTDERAYGDTTVYFFRES